MRSSAFYGVLMELFIQGIKSTLPDDASRLAELQRGDVVSITMNNGTTFRGFYRSQRPAAGWLYITTINDANRVVVAANVAVINVLLLSEKSCPSDRHRL